jgi:UDP-glucose 4-epimerase
VTRDYLHVADLARFCVLAGASHQVGPFNVGSGEGRSLNDIIDVIRRVTGADITPQYKPGRPVDVPRSVLDISRATNSFEWRPNISLIEGIDQTWAWRKGVH